VAEGTFDPIAGLIDPQTYDKIASQWTSFLDQPGGRASVLSAGLALMQPGGWGQNGAAQIGSAIGAGGEAMGRVEAMNLKQREADSKDMLRAAQADAAGARAGAAGQALEVQRLRNEGALTLGQLRAASQLRQMHSSYEKATLAEKNKIEGDILNPPVGKPGHREGPTPLPFEQWLQRDPAARELAARTGYSLGGGAGTTTAPPAVGGLSPVDQQALDWANQNPTDPRAQQIRDRLGQ
jgi:hypothetical protein